MMSWFLANVGSILGCWIVDLGSLGGLEGPMKVAWMDLHHSPVVGKNLSSNRLSSNLLSARLSLPH